MYISWELVIRVVLGLGDYASGGEGGGVGGGAWGGGRDNSICARKL